MDFELVLKTLIGEFSRLNIRCAVMGWDEAEIRHYIREQEKEDRRLDQLKMFE